ncbi:MAG: 5-(carboxyamino)imidazole ribonucleotide synthase [Fibrobacteres bacterium]|nr:5-(carboxyamino)imidazole ribonucleotide synthase [Fibrobacterota bacterium]
MKPLLPGATLGILGGGQLGRYMAIVAQQRGYRVAVLDPQEDAPAHQVAHYRIVAAYDDPTALGQLAEICQAVTFEFENVPASSLEPFQKAGVRIHPGAKALAICQDRILEKTAINACDIETARWAPIRTEADLYGALERFGETGILKTARSGYDGKGQAKVRGTAHAIQAWKAMGAVECVLEEIVPFAMECSVLAARDVEGNCFTHPVCENMHTHHILDVTVSPARVSESAARAMRSRTARIAQELDYVGHLAVEFFVLPDGEVLVNEIAPRPHNSGHLTIDTATASQFEEHVRCVTGWPVLPYEMNVQAAAMSNLLGDAWEGGEPRWERLAEHPDVRLHLYGKAEARPGRKMGHITGWADCADEAERVVRNAREALKQDSV